MFVVLFMMLHPTQELEPPANPVRFRRNDTPMTNDTGIIARAATVHEADHGLKQPSRRDYFSNALKRRKSIESAKDRSLAVRYSAHVECTS